MTKQCDDGKVTVRVEVEVCGGVVQKPASKTPTIKTTLDPIDLPLPWPADTPVTVISSVNHVAASGSKTNSGKAAVVVRAQAYADPTLDCNDDAYQEPPATAAVAIPLANGAYSFSSVKNNLVPGAACDALSGAAGQGADNSTLIVWFAFLGVDHWVPHCRRFHGYCPLPNSGSGTGPSSGTFMGAKFAAVLHATFHGSLASLGSVPLTWNGACWMGMSPAVGGVLLSCQSDGHGCTLLSAGPGLTFLVTGALASARPFHWSAKGVAAGHCAGPFSVTVTE